MESTEQALRRIADKLWEMASQETDYNVVIQLKGFSTQLHQLAGKQHDVDSE